MIGVSHITRGMGVSTLVLADGLPMSQALVENGAEMPDSFIDTLWAVIKRMQVCRCHIHFLFVRVRGPGEGRQRGLWIGGVWLMHASSA